MDNKGCRKTPSLRVQTAPFGRCWRVTFPYQQSTGWRKILGTLQVQDCKNNCPLELLIEKPYQNNGLYWENTTNNSLWNPRRNINIMKFMKRNVSQDLTASPCKQEHVRLQWISGKSKIIGSLNPWGLLKHTININHPQTRISSTFDVSGCLRKKLPQSSPCHRI